MSNPKEKNFPVPVRRLDDRLWLLELFHGPTLAFKDFGARFLARLFSDVLRDEHGGAERDDGRRHLARGRVGVDVQLLALPGHAASG